MTEHNVINVPITKNEINKQMEDKCIEHWSSKWKQYKHCRQTKNFYPTPSKALQKEMSKLSRSALATLIKIPTGQKKNLNYLTSIIYPGHSELCRFCEEDDETFIHLLNECPVFREHRLALLKGSVVVDTLELDPKILVRYAKHPDIEDALQRRSNE